MSRRTSRLLIAVATAVALLTPGPVAVADSKKASPWMHRIVEYETTPDGSHLVYSAQPNEDDIRLYSRNLATNVNKRLSPLDQLVTEVGGLTRPNTWSVTPDSSRVIYRAANPLGVVQLYSVPIGGGPAKRLNALLDGMETSQGVYNFWVSPNSDYVVWVEDHNGEYALFAAQADGTGRRRLHSLDSTFMAPVPSWGGPWPIAFSADGQRILVGLVRPGTNRSVVEVSLAGGGVTVLEENLSGDFLQALDYTNNGSAVTYFTDAWYFRPLAGGPAVQASPTGVTWLGYSRAGKWMMYGANNGTNQTGEFAIRRNAGLESFQVGPFRENQTNLGTSWTDDVYYFSDNTTFYQVSMADRATPIALHDIPIRTGSLSPNGEYFVGRTTSRYVVPTDPALKVAAIPDSGLDTRFAGFHPDGDRFGFVIFNSAATYDTSGVPENLDPRSKFGDVVDVQFLASGDIAYVGFRSGKGLAIFVADPYFCDGYLATHVGTNGNDTLVGSGMKDVMVGRGGNDTLQGLKGNDHLCGNGGADLLLGGNGRDRLFGMWGDDDLRAGNGNDTLNGGRGSDACKGGAGTDTATACETTAGVP